MLQCTWTVGLHSICLGQSHALPDTGALLKFFQKRKLILRLGLIVLREMVRAATARTPQVEAGRVASALKAHRSQTLLLSHQPPLLKVSQTTHAKSWGQWSLLRFWRDWRRIVTKQVKQYVGDTHGKGK